MLAREMASVCRLFRELWVGHEDWIVPEAPVHIEGAESPVWGGHDPLSGPEEPDDYMCCECGRWVPGYVPLHESVTNPWGYPLVRTTVTMAEKFFLNHPDSEAWQHGWHPGEVETRQDMAAVLALWPGDVCPDCYQQWTGEGV